MKKLLTTRSICISAVIAALYAALTLLLAPISYGDWQCRVSEALTMLPMLFPQAIPGLFVGCVLANLLGPSAGVIDIVFGSLATLIAAVGTWVFRKNKWLAAACPVLSNGVIVGAVLSLAYSLPFFLTALQVAVGEALAVAAGLVMVHYLRRADLEKLTR
ncbi:MAG: QueT transporter family protein [Clostridia bacterium]|nr:QueT transporter family protein [Clostridia bacterium]